MGRRRATGLIHHPYEPPAGFRSPQPPVHKGSTVIFSSVAAMRARDWRSKAGYTYGLIGTPTTFLLEERIAALENGKQCVLLPSGLAAIACTGMALLKTGDEVLVPDNAYGPSKALADGELKAWGITHQLYDAMNPADLQARITAKTKLVWLEAPGSVTMEFPPLAELAQVCRARSVLTALDNTWGAGLAFDGFDLDVPGSGKGADVVVQALTKYPSGGGDVLMGSIVTRDEALHLQIKLTHMRVGFGVGGNDAEMVLRSLPGMELRYHAQDRAARKVAGWLAERDEVVQLLHPAFEGSPGHAHWKALCGEHGAAAGLFSIVFDEQYGVDRVDSFCDSLKLFKLGYSWGGPVSLVVPYDVSLMRSPRLATWPHKGLLVRFSIGLEDVGDLIDDLDQAFEALA